jgi:hypothetical protein
MKCAVSSRVLVLLYLVSLPGCARLTDWGRRNFYQGEQVDNNAQAARCYIRSAPIYDQFTTRAIFDALWLSDDVRIAYAQLHAKRLGKPEEHKKAFLWRQLEENNHYIAFYVLSLYEVPLGDEDSEWAVFLTVGDRCYFPIEIKTVALAPEYQVFLKKYLTPFKVPYLIKFSAFDVEEKPILTDDVREIALNFRSADKQVALHWSIDDDATAIIPSCVPAYEPKTMRRPKRCGSWNDETHNSCDRC